MAVESPTSETEGRRPKSLLICPTCGHESPPSGDWLARERATTDDTKLALLCPECETTITYRPLGGVTPREDRTAPTCR